MQTNKIGAAIATAKTTAIASAKAKLQDLIGRSHEGRAADIKGSVQK
jgi:hypothetical protein